MERCQCRNFLMKALMKSNVDLVKIILGKDSNFPETLWAKRTNDESVFEINNVPFYDYSVSLGDKVRAVSIWNNFYEYVGVESRGRHSTYRIIWNGERPSAKEFISIIGLKNVSIETNWTLFAIDVPPENLDRLAWFVAYLDKMENAGVLSYEEWYLFMKDAQ